MSALTSGPDVSGVVTGYKGSRLSIKNFNHIKLMRVCPVFAELKVSSGVPIVVDEQFPYFVVY